MQKKDVDSDWIDDGDKIKLHKASDFAAMRKAGRLAAETLDFITPHVVPGITTEALDKLCHDFIVERKAIPAPLNYRGFPKSICTSINHVVCHGIPGPKKLQDGDTINIDVTVILDGWHGDTSRMYNVGKVGVQAQRLTDVTYEAMMRGIEAAQPGATLGDVGHAIQSFAEKQKFSVVRDFCGHGIGKVFHDSPSVLHFGRKDTGPEIKPGMFFTVEPMINAGTYDVFTDSDKWTVRTKDGKLSAHFEHTVAVTSTGPVICTMPKGANVNVFEMMGLETVGASA
mgnify:CR=1 FL=1